MAALKKCIGCSVKKDITSNAKNRGTTCIIVLRTKSKINLTKRFIEILIVSKLLIFFRTSD